MPRLRAMARSCSEQGVRSGGRILGHHDDRGNGEVGGLVDDRRDAFLRRDNDHEVGNFGNRGEIGVAGTALDFRVVRIDEMERAGKSSRDDIVHHGAASRVLAVAGAEQGYGFRRDRPVQLACAHVNRSCSRVMVNQIAGKIPPGAKPQVFDLICACPLIYGKA